MAKTKGSGKAKKATPTPAQAAESAQGATGREMAVERQGEEGRLKGLNRYPPGSNGGVQRGPDRYPRINASAGVMMKALMKEGPVLVVELVGAKIKKKLGGRMPASMVENLATRLHLIPLTGTNADVLRLTGLIHEIYKPPKNGNGNGHGTPTSTSFIRPPQAAPTSTETGPEDGPPDGLRDADGKEYVET